MKLMSIIKKQGNLAFIKRLLKAGTIHTIIGELLLLGKDRTALEIARLSIEFKTKSKLQKKYGKYLEEFDKVNSENDLEHISSDIIWFCWFQGLDNAPKLVRKCYESLKRNLYNHKIVVITADNITNYVDFPPYIIEKWDRGIITNTHMTDLLRLELLIKYGGTWIDATVLCTRDEKEIPNYYFDTDLFFYQILKPGRDGCSTYMSSWYITAKSNNKILLATRYLCYKYWEKNNFLIDYFLLHDFMSIVLEKYQEDWKNVIPVDNATPHILLLRLFEQYNIELWQSIVEQSPFHKLSYKFSKEQEQTEGTFYKKIVG